MLLIIMNNLNRHVEIVPFYLPHTMLNAYSIICIHKHIILLSTTQILKNLL